MERFPVSGIKYIWFYCMPECIMTSMTKLAIMKQMEKLVNGI
jgi:hypothetical protein